VGRRYLDLQSLQRQYIYTLRSATNEDLVNPRIRLKFVMTSEQEPDYMKRVWVYKQVILVITSPSY